VSESSVDAANDSLLMSALAAGDTTALGTLVERHQASVLSTAYRLLGRWDQAEDVAQEVFIRVYRAAPGYTPSAAFTTWLYHIVFNLCQDTLRKRRPTAELPPDDPGAGGGNPSHTLEEEERTATVRRAVAELPDRQRIAVVLHRYGGLSHSQIAEATGWSRSAVESCLVRAYSNLRHELAELYP
jgi:RNA polymerase sigma-70 factor, ECF subfamily